LEVYFPDNQSLFLFLKVFFQLAIITIKLSTKEIEIKGFDFLNPSCKVERV
jgi:hypothetical protein